MAVTTDQKLVHTARLVEISIPTVRPGRVLESQSYSEAHATGLHSSPHAGGFLDLAVRIASGRLVVAYKHAVLVGSVGRISGE